MRTLQRLAVSALALTYLHLTFGGIVRITGSGMGCGDHWPKCLGSWIPPFDHPTIMIEWTHRLLALLVMLSIATFTVLARRWRARPGVGGPGGVLPLANVALVLVIAVALVGMVTVKLGNATLATVAHWTLALTLLAVLAAAAVRTGAFGADAARAQGGSTRAVRSLGAGAALAFLTVVMGGVVAKYPGAAVACRGFPLCGDSAAGVPGGAAPIQLTHRVLAYLLFIHVLAVSAAVTRRPGESRVAIRAAKTAAVLVLLQLGVGAAMVMSMLPATLRSVHQAVGIGVWLALFLAVYLARIATVRTV